MSDAYYLWKPNNQKFYQVLATLITFLGLGDQKWWGYDPISYKVLFFANKMVIYICAPTVLISQVIYLFKNYNDLTFNIRGIIFAIVPVTAYVNLILYSTKQKSYEKVMKEFMNKIHLHNLHNEDAYVKKVTIKVEKMTRFSSYYISVFIMIDWFAWCTTTGINNYHNRDLIQNKTMRMETIIYHYLPFDYEYNYFNWLFVHTANIYLVWCGCVLIAVYNSTNYIFIFQLIGHIEILKYTLKTELNGNFSQKEIREKLINVIKYHTFVLDIFRDIQSAFNVNVAGYYFYNLVADSLNMYQLMAGDKRNIFIYGLMLVVYAGGLIMMSFVLEEIRRQSDGLSEIVYDLPWEHMSVSNRKMVFLILLRIQPALVFKAAGGLRAGVRPMISIFKTSFTYYVILKSSMKT